MSLIILLRAMSDPESGPHAFAVCRMLKVLKIVMPPLRGTPGLRGGVPSSARRLNLPAWRGEGDVPGNVAGDTQAGRSSSANSDSAHEENGSRPRPDLALDDLITMISGRHVRGGLEKVVVQWAGWSGCPWSDAQIKKLSLLAKGGLIVGTSWNGGGLEFAPGM
ncbi:hypothetical protein BDV98DRAFT_571353 [Pterulicium gracile]|uniref:Uncharacterized protein n=1 Tax=Pterulicium gracile TaxID=1884261 RepID=A0A5C3QLP3_9AGAR|nr:hypothetical protein BDV98DRAFT_571353 [Pterula gracilis]